MVSDLPKGVIYCVVLKSSLEKSWVNVEETSRLFETLLCGRWVFVILNKHLFSRQRVHILLTDFYLPPSFCR